MGRNFYLSLFLFSFIFTNAIAQSGEIRGQIKERGGKDGVPFASVAATQGGQQIIATITDLDGNYTLKPLGPGKYDLKATCVGYSPAQTNGVLVTVDKISFVNMELGKGIDIAEVAVVDYKVPLLDKGQTAVQKTMTFEEIVFLNTQERPPQNDLIKVIANNIATRAWHKATTSKGLQQSATSEFQMQTSPISALKDKKPTCSTSANALRLAFSWFSPTTGEAEQTSTAMDGATLNKQ